LDEGLQSQSNIYWQFSISIKMPNP